MIYFDFLKALFKDVKKSINQEIKEDKAVIKEIIALMVKTYHQDKQTIKEEISQSKLVRELDSVLDAYMKRDPAAKSKLEVLLLYPGDALACLLLLLKVSLITGHQNQIWLGFMHCGTAIFFFGEYIPISAIIRAHVCFIFSCFIFVSFYHVVIKYEL